MSSIVQMESSKIAYLTFDDGPNYATEQILNILAHYNATGTFFMLEPHIRQFPNTVRRMLYEGHALGLHGVSHKVDEFYASWHSVIQELDLTRIRIQQVTGTDTVLVRTPYGSMPHLKRSQFKAIEQKGYRLWDWNVDSLDWKYKNDYSVSLVKKNVRRLDKSRVNPVILLHDLKETAQFLPKIILFLKKRGYRLDKLDSSLKPLNFVGNCQKRTKG
jgi:peptidoglycan/xylan/chitin deacetylase (PgdA/CDA1 family)